MLKRLLDQTGITPEVAARIACNAGLSPARTVRLLHGLLDLNVEALKMLVRKVFKERETEHAMAAAQVAVELDALVLKEMTSKSLWPAIALTNFSITDSIELTYDGKQYDLHNFADFQGFSHDATQNQLRLSWVIFEFGREGGNRVCLEVQFEAVDYLTIHPRDPEVPTSEDMTLRHIGFLGPGMWEQATYFQLPGRANDPQEMAAGEAILFQFQGGQAVVVHAKSARIRIIELQDSGTPLPLGSA